MHKQYLLLFISAEKKKKKGLLKCKHAFGKRVRILRCGLDPEVAFHICVSSLFFFSFFFSTAHAFRGTTANIHGQ